MCGSDKQENLKTATASISEAVNRGAEIVVLPEMFNCPYSNDSFQPFSELLPSTFPSSYQSLALESSLSSITIAKLAQQHKVYIVAGSIPEYDENNKLYNSCLVINPNGEFIAKHRKVHLFDIDVPGKMTFKESDTLTAGNKFTVFNSPWGDIGVGICYDLRFPEYAQLLSQSSENVTMLIYPGAFNTVTGPMHWELLARARAVDNQLFVALCSPARNPASTYQAYGHSLCVDPFGTILSTTEEQSAIVMAEFDLSQVNKFRTMIPTIKQKRKDLYSLTKVTKDENQ